MCLCDLSNLKVTQETNPGGKVGAGSFGHKQDNKPTKLTWRDVFMLSIPVAQLTANCAAAFLEAVRAPAEVALIKMVFRCSVPSKVSRDGSQPVSDTNSHVEVHQTKTARKLCTDLLRLRCKKKKFIIWFQPENPLLVCPGLYQPVRFTFTWGWAPQNRAPRWICCCSCLS